MASIQIRNVPPKLHLELRRRAAAQGISMQEYLLGELVSLAETPPIDEVIARIRTRQLYSFEESSADTLAALRRGRDEQLDSR